MNTIKTYLIITLIACLSVTTYTQDTKDQKTNQLLDQKTIQQSPESILIPDPAFDGFVNISLAGQALCAGDEELLTDTALQLAAAENILMRKHKSGVTAEALLTAAVNLAKENRNKEALARLAKIADALSNPNLVNKVVESQKYSDSTNKTADLTISVKEMSPEDYEALHETLSRIMLAKVTRDRSILEGWEENCGFESGSKYYNYIKTQITGTLSEIPKTEGEKNILSKLAEESRSGDDYSLDLNIGGLEISAGIGSDSDHDHGWDRDNDHGRNRWDNDHGRNRWDNDHGRNRWNDHRDRNRWRDRDRDHRDHRQQYICGSCNGKGITSSRCTICYGKGWFQIGRKARQRCYHCSGNGWMSSTCYRCNGTGRVYR